MWSAETALLLVSCRGHEGEVTDLALSPDNTIVASSSTDTTIRCWSLEVRHCAACCPLGRGISAASGNSLSWA